MGQRENSKNLSGIESYLVVELSFYCVLSSLFSFTTQYYDETSTLFRVEKCEKNFTATHTHAQTDTSAIRWSFSLLITPRPSSDFNMTFTPSQLTSDSRFGFKTSSKPGKNDVSTERNKVFDDMRKKITQYFPFLMFGVYFCFRYKNGRAGDVKKK